MSGSSPCGVGWGGGKGAGTEQGRQNLNPGFGAYRLWVGHQDRLLKSVNLSKSQLSNISLLVPEGQRGGEKEGRRRMVVKRWRAGDGGQREPSYEIL